jgi:hypothetical protein
MTRRSLPRPAVGKSQRDFLAKVVSRYMQREVTVDMLPRPNEKWCRPDIANNDLELRLEAAEQVLGSLQELNREIMGEILRWDRRGLKVQ